MKYKLSMSDHKIVDSQILIRIIRRDGELGGYISCEENLSQEGTCWVHNGSIAMGNSVVSGDAQIARNSIVKDDSTVEDHAIVYNSLVCGKSKITDHSSVVRTTVKDIVLEGHIKILSKCFETPTIISGFTPSPLVIYNKTLQIDGGVYSINTITSNAINYGQLVKANKKFYGFKDVVKAILSAYRLSKEIKKEKGYA